MRNTYDVIVIGGGPAGLSAALILGRCRRRVLVCDEGKPRNSVARALHGYLSRDGIAPHRLLELGGDELKNYDVRVRRVRVLDAERVSLPASKKPLPGSRRLAGARRGGFRVSVTGGRSFYARKLILATGVQDILPPIPGIEAFYGTSVHHCPYCDGWEHRDERIVAYGEASKIGKLALELRAWSRKITVCSDGSKIPFRDRKKLQALGIRIREERITRLAGRNMKLLAVHFAAGPALPADALFFSTGQEQYSDLPRKLGCRVDGKGKIRTDDRQCTTVPSVFFAGDADGDTQFVIGAAAEGAKAGVSVNKELTHEIDAA